MTTTSSANPAALLPPGFVLAPDAGLRVLARGTVLAGGSPVRVLRLRPGGASTVAAWFAGEPVGESAQARQLARTLLDHGMAHPVPSGGPCRDDVTVVIPVRDRAAELGTCLAGLSDLRVIVVDDASRDPAATAAVARAAVRAADRGIPPVQVIYRDVNGGPAAARNTGLAAAATQVVAFLDSDCVPAPGWLDRLLPHLCDPCLGAVAPRIVPHASGRGWLARYESASSTLDMGTRPSIVRPGARVSYVPGAALVVRKKAAGTGFDEGMRVGEDVDFAWRMARSGWRVRYEPAAVMGHRHRDVLRPWLSRRREYGTSAAPLELRHPGSVRPLYVSGWTAGAWLAVASRRPGIAVALTGAATGLLARRLIRVVAAGSDGPADGSGGSAGPDGCAGSSDSAAPDGSAGEAAALAARLVVGGTAAAIRPIGSAITRTWLPLAVPAAIAFPRLRLPLAAAIFTPPLLDWLERRPALDPARYTAARLLDDAGYSAGVWQGCLEHRTIRPLLPVVLAHRPAGRHRRPDATGQPADTACE